MRQVQWAQRIFKDSKEQLAVYPVVGEVKIVWLQNGLRYYLGSLKHLVLHYSI